MEKTREIKLRCHLMTTHGKFDDGFKNTYEESKESLASERLLTLNQQNLMNEN
jgi:hypothetical protein